MKKHRDYFTKIHKENAKIHRDFLSPIYKLKTKLCVSQCFLRDSLRMVFIKVHAKIELSQNLKLYLQTWNLWSE
ncbi:hypothetical protein B0E44_13830 [Flavobacterium sp. A45]|nr:hypothetical protein B0E44_13830 [Flavobacterium sp. A45]